MGMMLGRVTVEQAKFDVLENLSDHVEVRRYHRAVAVETDTGGDGIDGQGNSDAFRRLAAYIGVFQTPQNRKPGEGSSEKIAMTAPVITSTAPNEPEPIAMTAPVLNGTRDGEGTKIMQFLLPQSLYTDVSEAPEPTDERVQLRQVEERTMAVLQFYGSCSEATAEERAEELLEVLRGSKYRIVGEQQRYTLARYNPPWTLWWTKRNEVSFQVCVPDATPER